MARQIRKKSGTGIYHVMPRGINRQDIFEDDEDYLQMTSILCPTAIKTNWCFIWSCSEVNKMITRTP